MQCKWRIAFPVTQKVRIFGVAGEEFFAYPKFFQTNIANALDTRGKIVYNNQVSLVFNREGRDIKMAEVKLKEGETLDSALRRFKRQCARSGVLAELRKREHYEKPSVKRKKKSEAARKRKYK